MLHSIATFHSEHASQQGPPDLMLWFADPQIDPGEQPVFSIDAVLLKPLSRGSVRLRSANPTDRPEVVLPDLREASDIARLGEAYQCAFEVMNHREIRHLCGELPAEITDVADLRRHVRANRYSIPHVVGTCAMGLSPDAGAVVDASGSVHGTQRLSVVDASIMPDVPSGFPHLSTLMIAERLSERIDQLVRR
jgi:choline dehydrogenase-like flavoprotein